MKHSSIFSVFGTWSSHKNIFLFYALRCDTIYLIHSGITNHFGHLGTFNSEKRFPGKYDTFFKRRMTPILASTESKRHLFFYGFQLHIIRNTSLKSNLKPMSKKMLSISDMQWPNQSNLKTFEKLTSSWDKFLARSTNLTLQNYSPVDFVKLKKSKTLE